MYSTDVKLEKAYLTVPKILQLFEDFKIIILMNTLCSAQSTVHIKILQN